jgi:hypothetical protein
MLSYAGSMFVFIIRVVAEGAAFVIAASDNSLNELSWCHFHCLQYKMLTKHSGQFGICYLRISYPLTYICIYFNLTAPEISLYQRKM